MLNPHLPTLATALLTILATAGACASSGQTPDSTSRRSAVAESPDAQQAGAGQTEGDPESTPADEATDDRGAGDESAQGERTDATTDSEIPVGPSPVLGPSDAPVTIVEFSSFKCPDCASAYELMKPVLKEYGSKVRLVHKDVTIPGFITWRARAGWAAHQQGEFWAMYRLLYENQSKLHNESDVIELARTLNLDIAAFESDMESPEALEHLKREYDLARAHGVEVFPTFFINGQKLVSPDSSEAFRRLIARVLEEQPQ